MPLRGVIKCPIRLVSDALTLIFGGGERVGHWEQLSGASILTSSRPLAGGPPGMHLAQLIICIICLSGVRSRFL